MANDNDVRSRLAAIRARRAAITGGEWTATNWPGYPGWVNTTLKQEGNPHTLHIGENMSHCDATFLAAAPSDYDEMLAIIDALEPAPTADERLDRFGQRLVGILNDNTLDNDEMFEALSKLASEMRWLANTAPTAAGAAEPGNAATEHVTVERAHVEGRYPYRWQEEGGKWHTVTNIVNDGKTDEYEIWFEAVDPDAWAVVRRTEKLLRGGAL